MRTLTASLVGAALLALVPALASAETLIHAKPGVSGAQIFADTTECTAQATEGRRAATTFTPPTSSVAAAAGASFLVGIMQGMADTRARRLALDFCMRGRGYEPLTMTDAETRDLRAARDDLARQSWLDSWLARPEVQTRVTEAHTPVNEPFAPIPVEPYAFGAVRLDRNSLQVAPGPLRRGALIRGQARYRVAARLTATYEMGGMLNYRMSQGQIMHGSSYAETFDEASAPVWCGPMTNGSIRGPIEMYSRCFVRTPRGYVSMVNRSGAAWIEGLDNYGEVGDFFPGAMRLEPVDPASLPPLDFELRVVRAGGNSLILEAVAPRNDEDVVFWRGEAPWVNGRAVVPFWEHRLVVTQTRDGVRAALTPDGDGTGLLSLTTTAN